MFILKIKNIVYLFKLLNNKILILQKIKQLRKLKSLSIKNANNLQNLITYIINIEFTKKNILLYVTDIKGSLKTFKSTNSLNLTKQKTKQPILLLKLLKKFFLNDTFLKNKAVAIHFKNFNKRYIDTIVKILENILFLKTIKIYNFLIPHNGCRPKKIKRKKKRKIKFN